MIVLCVDQRKSITSWWSERMFQRQLGTDE